MRQRQLAMLLSRLPLIENPLLSLEQYPTEGDLASRWIYKIYERGDIVDRVIADLGSGNGILGFACALMGAKAVKMIEMDGASIDVISSNKELLRSELENIGYPTIDIFNHRVTSELPDELQSNTIIMNPPWGRQTKGADRPFLEAAFNSNAEVIHLMHSSDVKHPLAMAEESGWMVEHILDADFRIRATFHHHKNPIRTSKATCWRFSRH
jgi:putative methylase